MNRYGERVWQG